MFEPRPLTPLYPAEAESLEEVCLDGARAPAAALAFALARAGREDGLALIVPRPWLAERGLPFSIGGLLIEVGRETDGLWAMEQALRSGAVGGVVGMVEGADLTQTRRLDMAARTSGARAVLLRRNEGGLSAARRRWRVGAAPSASHPFDPRAPGAARIRAELTRSRGEPPGVWMLEQDNETHRFRVVDRLAGHGLVEDRRTVAAA